MLPQLPVVYTLPSCRACARLKEDWNRDGIAFEERPVNEDQAVLDEALAHGDMVPIIVYPDGRVEVGYKDLIS